jgi:agmatinase
LRYDPPGMPPTFDPSAAAAADSGIYGLPYSAEESEVLIVPVPFDATTSYRKGAAGGPEAVLRASRQVDLYDLSHGRFYERGIHLLPANERIAKLNAEASRLAQGIIEVGGRIEGDELLGRALARVNDIGSELNSIVHESVTEILEQDKLPVVLGGDHAVPFGAWKACAEQYAGFGLLHFDAHADLRRAYEGFEWSHASILWNAMERIDGIERLVQVGIRDLCEEEASYISDSDGRVRTLYDRRWARAKMKGEDLPVLARKWLARLPKTVWVSFDIDGLDPTLCPGTGTPVPGGLSWHEALMWLELLAASGRRVLGIDLVEVAPSPTPPNTDSWDANVGARLLYKMIGSALATRT